MIYVLLLLLVCLACASLMVHGGDWMAPGVIVPLTFAFSTVCAIYNIDLWDIELGFSTVAVIFGGVFLFVFFSIWFLRGRPKAIDADAPGESVARIELSMRIQVLLLAFFIFSTVLYYRYLVASFDALGVAGGNWNDMMYERRQASSDVDMSSLTSMPTYVVYIYNTMHAIAFVVLYIVANNMISKGGLKKDLPLCCCLLIYLLSVILRSGRLPILELAFAFGLVYWVVWHRRYGWKGKIRLSYVLGTVACFALLLVVFSSLRELVGRQNDADLLTYITNYAGGSIELLDLFLKDPPSSSDIFGQETFRGVVAAMARHFGLDTFAYSWQLEFRYVNGICVGNVYTAFRYWIYDFGYVGFVVMLFIYACFYNLFYNRIVCSKRTRKFDYGLCIYSYLFSGLIMLPIQDVLFAMDLNPGGIYTLCCIAFFGWLLVDRPSKEHRGAQDRALTLDVAAPSNRRTGGNR